MKKSIIFPIRKSPFGGFRGLAFLFATLLSMLAVSFSAQAQTYAETDKAALRAFLRQESATAGTANFTKLGLATTDTATWTTNDTWITKVTGLTWNNNSPKRISSINWGFNSLAGSLNLSGCDSLTTLACSSNSLSTLDITQNTALTVMICAVNSLTSLDITQNTALTTLYCANNSLTSLDITQNTALTYLNCADNPLSTLDITKNTALTSLYCSNNSLSTLDITQNTALTYLDCFSNSLSNLDITKNTALTALYCASNSLSTLDITQNTALTYLDCSENLLSTLDITQNTALTNLNCSGNRLPLHNLYAASQRTSNSKSLGTQTSVYFADTTIAIHSVLNFSSEEAFGDPAMATVFNVRKGSANADTITDYIISDGKITFLSVGTYTVSMTNDSIRSINLVTAFTGNIIVHPVYTITASTGIGGNISPSGMVQVDSNANQTFTITPNTGYRLDSVLVDGINNTTAITAKSYTFNNVRADHTIRAVFRIVKYDITASAEIGGSIDPNGTVQVDSNMSKTFTIATSTGYRLDSVLVDGVNNTTAITAKSYTFNNVTAAHSIRAVFKQICYDLATLAKLRILFATTEVPGKGNLGTLLGYDPANEDWEAYGIIWSVPVNDTDCKHMLGVDTGI